jgi:polyisoprenoid-binding protein YceI
MTTTTTVPKLEGTYDADTIHSTFGFAVRHADISTYRGNLSDVEARLTAGDEGPVLEGSAGVESISIQNPPEFRSHVLGGEFFDAEEHPRVSFRSTKVDLSEDGRARVEGELTIRGISREVTATGSYEAPRESGGGLRSALELEATFDRRDFGFDWQMEMPGGAEALGWDVTLEIHLELVQAQE